MEKLAGKWWRKERANWHWVYEKKADTENDKNVVDFRWLIVQRED